ncbi:hypothetical protein [Paraburkholderia phenoliruptrix]|jgi:hypothetical protein|uniref:Uncharacterized protein n=1 Tax=Paraburkholderia phenoliruptrix TaxID=252970 RepID=A0ABV3W6A1_9BURK|nr:hypothetical protein [Paraburkholderia phenoliruptrix]MDR6390117.1 hypothetical protein [Paraburkholderia phenoliruptrix]WMY12415.1 hypothetical protein P3F88_23855 [Paraburkholderia phenoliruptrix]
MEEGRPHGHWRDLPLASRAERFAFTSILIGFGTVYVFAVIVVFLLVAIAMIPVRIFSAIAGVIRAAKRRG